MMKKRKTELSKKGLEDSNNISIRRSSIDQNKEDIKECNRINKKSELLNNRINRG